MPNYDAVRFEVAIVPATKLVRFVVYIPDQDEPALNLHFSVDAAEAAHREIGKAINLLKRMNEDEPGSPN